MKEWFRYFLRKNYPQVMGVVENEQCDEIGVEFDKYMKEKCAEEVLEKIMPKDAMEVILQADHPLKMNGFHPALLLHFDEFVKKMQSEIEEES